MEPDLRDPSPSTERHADWRARCLRHAGFDAACPPALAERIATPLDREPGER